MTLLALFTSQYTCPSCEGKLSVRFDGDDTHWWCSWHGMQTGYVLEVAPDRRPKRRNNVIDITERRNGHGSMPAEVGPRAVVPEPAPRPWYEIARAQLIAQAKQIEALRAQIAALKAEYQRTHAALTAYGMEGLPEMPSAQAPETHQGIATPWRPRVPSTINPPRPCAICGTEYRPQRKDSLYCGATCRNEAKRQREEALREAGRKAAQA